MAQAICDSLVSNHHILRFLTLKFENSLFYQKFVFCDTIVTFWQGESGHRGAVCVLMVHWGPPSSPEIYQCCISHNLRIGSGKPNFTHKWTTRNFSPGNHNLYLNKSLSVQDISECLTRVRTGVYPASATSTATSAIRTQEHN